MCRVKGIDFFFWCLFLLCVFLAVEFVGSLKSITGLIKNLSAIPPEANPPMESP